MFHSADVNSMQINNSKLVYCVLHGKRAMKTLYSIVKATCKLLERKRVLVGLPGVLGIWGEGLFIFRELGSTTNYFRGAGEQAHTFGDLGSTAKK